MPLRRPIRLFERRTLWCPTWPGVFCVLLLLVIPPAWWFLCGESFLSLTDRLPAEVLVVEGWIGANGVRAAAAEFRGGGYRYVVATGSQPDDDRGWQEPGWSYAQGAANELARSGIPMEKIIVALARDTERQRTYESAVAVSRKLRSLSIDPKYLNVFTWGPHARRSRLVFEKVCAQHTGIGVVSWVPVAEEDKRWWLSSEGAREFLTESAGYLFELFFNSGRSTNAPQEITVALRQPAKK
jgi:uncharacterized SAM-binding protein YcdF (DUF218 family)